MEPLWQQCNDGQLERVRLALRDGVDVNRTDEHGAPALVFAVHNKHHGIVKLLLEQPDIEVNITSY